MVMILNNKLSVMGMSNYLKIHKNTYPNRLLTNSQIWHNTPKIPIMEFGD